MIQLPTAQGNLALGSTYSKEEPMDPELMATITQADLDAPFDPHSCPACLTTLDPGQHACHRCQLVRYHEAADECCSDCHDASINHGGEIWEIDERAEHCCDQCYSNQ